MIPWVFVILLELVLFWLLVKALLRVQVAQASLIAQRPRIRQHLKRLNKQARELRHQVAVFETQAHSQLIQLPIQLSLLCLKPSPLQWLLAEGLRRGIHRMKAH